MRVMILAAGRGERLRPITDTIPKPLLEVGGETLVARHIRRLAEAGVKDIVINVSWLGEQICEYVGDGSQWDVRIHYSDEGDRRLETAGGIRKAYSLLDDGSNDPQFAIVNADLWTDYDFSHLKPLRVEQQAHLVMVPNPDFLPQGDFALDNEWLVASGQNELPTYTYSGISVFRLKLFTDLPVDQSLPLRKVLSPLIENRQASGDIFSGVWFNIGNEKILATARDYAASVDNEAPNEQPPNTVASTRG